jgi:hypothetical protein
MRVFVAVMISCVLVVLSASLFVYSLMREFFPKPDNANVAAGEVARGVDGGGRSEFRTPSEIATGESSPTPNVGLLRPASDVPKPPATVAGRRETDLERISESHQRRLAGLKSRLAGEAGELRSVHETMQTAVVDWKHEKKMFDYELSVRRRSPHLGLPTPTPPRRLPTHLPGELLKAIGKFERAVEQFINDAKEEAFSFRRDTAGVRRSQEVECDWLAEALALPDVAEAFYISHARERLVLAFTLRENDLQGKDRDFLAGVVPPAFTFGCIKRLNQLRFDKNPGFTPCFVDPALLAMAQDHARWMAQLNTLDPNYLDSDFMNGNMARKARESLVSSGIAVERVVALCVQTEEMPREASWLVDYLATQGDAEWLLSNLDLAGIGASKSSSGVWYVSFVLGGH